MTTDQGNFQQKESPFLGSLERRLAPLLSERVLARLDGGQWWRLMTVRDASVELRTVSEEQWIKTVRGFYAASVVKGFLDGNPSLRTTWQQAVDCVRQDDEMVAYAQRVIEFVSFVKKALDQENGAEKSESEKPWRNLRETVNVSGLSMTLSDLLTMLAVELAEQDRLREIARLEPGLAG